MGPPPLVLGSTVWDWSRPYILGVLNVTPDSFSDGGRWLGVDAAVDRALAMVSEGADALDIGGESTRPGAAMITPEAERSRVIPVLAAIARRVSVPLSVDTTHREVAREALDVGASILNDVCMGDSAAELAAVVASAGGAYIAMHARGTPMTMATLARYDSPVTDVARELRSRVATIERAGVPPGRILVDPGIGFAKTPVQSIELLADLAPIRALGYAVCVGPSRKSFIAARGAYDPTWAMPEVTPANERQGGTAAAVTACVLQGVQVLRVHDVGVMRQAARVAHGVVQARARHA